MMEDNDLHVVKKHIDKAMEYLNNSICNNVKGLRPGHILHNDVAYKVLEMIEQKDKDSLKLYMIVS